MWDEKDICISAAVHRTFASCYLQWLHPASSSRWGNGVGFWVWLRSPWCPAGACYGRESGLLAARRAAAGPACGGSCCGSRSRAAASVAADWAGAVSAATFSSASGARAAPGKRARRLCLALWRNSRSHWKSLWFGLPRHLGSSRAQPLQSPEDTKTGQWVHTSTSGSSIHILSWRMITCVKSPKN